MENTMSNLFNTTLLTSESNLFPSEDPDENFALYINAVTITYALSYIPQIALIMRTGDYSGVSFGFVLFGVVRSYFEYELQNEYDSWRDFLTYIPFFALVGVATFYWLKKAFVTNAAAQTEKISEKQALSANSATNLAFPEFEWFNLVYIFMLLAVFTVSLLLNEYDPRKIAILTMSFIPMLRGGQYLSQSIHIWHRGHTKGISLLSSILMLLAPLLEAAAILYFMYTHEKPYMWALILVLHDVPSVIISFMTLAAFCCYPRSAYERVQTSIQV